MQETLTCKLKGLDLDSLRAPEKNKKTPAPPLRVVQAVRSLRYPLWGVPLFSRPEKAPMKRLENVKLSSNIALWSQDRLRWPKTAQDRPKTGPRQPKTSPRQA